MKNSEGAPYFIPSHIASRFSQVLHDFEIELLQLKFKNGSNVHKTYRMFKTLDHVAPHDSSAAGWSVKQWFAIAKIQLFRRKKKNDLQNSLS